MKNGEQINRSWLVYSQTKDVVFCFCCKLFCNSDIFLATAGFNDWRNLHQHLKEHETSKNHLRSLTNWIELSNRLRTGTTIDAVQQRQLNSEILRWQAVLERLLAIINFLAEQCLAFRGASDILYENNNGNFLKLVELLAKFDNVMAEHVRRVKDGEIHTHYLGKNTQNEIIELISNGVHNEILSNLKHAKYYSIIVDCTQDLSKTEQMSIVLRFLKIDENAEVKICKHFLEFIPVNETTGKALTDVILQRLEHYGIPLENMRGQGYDNGSNMRGRHAGVQQRILNLNNRAFFIPCHAHSLNLVVSDAAKSSKDAVSYFTTVQAIYNFFSASTHRWAVLKKHLEQKLTLKPLSQTRWESRIEDLSYDPSFRHEAETLAQKMMQFQFSCCTVIWHNILNQINLTSKVMQNRTIDISEAKMILNKTLEYLKKYHSDEGFEETVKEATTIAEDLDFEPTFAPQQFIRPRKKTRQFCYEAHDDPILDPHEWFRVECFYCILDVAITSTEERFCQLHGHCETFEFLYDIGNIKNQFSKEDLMKQCQDLHLALSTDNAADIDAVELYDELIALSELISPKTSPLKVLEFIARNDFFSPNTAIALRILLTLPVSVASDERSFSKLKLLKNYLRSTMTQNRMSGLALISIEFKTKLQSQKT
uniref:TTF-type domain-containing protein n=1 Tax=Chrysemys picta bellii TaxID=8478 RepID=A0A8C3HBI5_CHRPI